MKKAYSHFAVLALAALAFSSCSRANYATNQPATPLTEASVAQVPSPAAELSAQVVAPMPTETVATVPQPQVAVAPAPSVAPRRIATTAARPTSASTASTTEASTLATANAQFSAKTTKPTLVQRMMLKKVTKQLTKAESRQQNVAGVEQTAATSGSLTILLVGLVLLLVGILISAGWLITAGSIVALVGLILLLLKAL